MSQKLIATLRGFVAVVLMLFATNFLPVAAAFADTASTDVAWDQQGRDKADPNCLLGQTANFHYILAGAGTDITNAGMITVNFSPSGTDSDTGTLHAANGNSKASATYDVSSSYDAVATSATVSGAVWENGNGRNSDTPLLTLSSSSCSGTATPQDTVITPPTLNTDVVCGPSNDVTTLLNSSDSAHYTVSHSAGSSTYTVTANSGYTFSTGKTVTLTVPTDANTACPDTVITPPTLNTDVVCGPSNDVTTLLNSSDSAHYTVSHVGNVYNVTANSGYTFSTGKTVTLTVPADANTACPQPEDKKVYVCKYVGTPGVDERLKNGNDGLVLVSTHAIEHNQWDGTVPGYFSDAHDRSYVLGYESDFEVAPTSADCPASRIAIPAVPTITDLCGTGNATWNVPANTDQVKYILGSDGHLRVHTIFGFVFSDGSHSHDYGVAVETNTSTCGSVLGDIDVCLNITGDQATVPAGMTKDATTGNCITTVLTGGRGGDVLGASTAQLANTGESIWTNVLVGATVIAMTLALTVLSRRSVLES